jgi:tetratricopeptide (TPR) repeat protein
MLSALVMVVLVAPGARAQSRAPRGAGPARSESVEPVVTAETRTHQRQGEVLFEAENYNGALAEFRRVYDLMEGHPNRYLVLFNIAQSYERLLQYDAALEYYRRYLAEAPAAAPQRGLVEGTVHALEGLLATIDLEVQIPDVQVWVDDREIGVAPGQLHIPSGRHTIELRARGYLPARREVLLTARATQHVVMRMEPVPRARRGLGPGLFWAGVATTSVLVVGSISTGIAAVAMRAVVDSRLSSADLAVQQQVTEDDRDHIRTAMNLCDVLWGAALVFGVGTAITYAVTDWRAHREGAAHSTAPTVFLAPLLRSAGNGDVLGLNLVGALDL